MRLIVVPDRRHRGERKKKECVGKKPRPNLFGVWIPVSSGFGNVIYGGAQPGLSCAILTGKFLQSKN